MPHEPRVLWKILEKHLEGLEPAMGRFEASLSSATMTLGDVAAGPERTLLSHIDGIVLGGEQVLQERILPLLAGEEPPALPLVTASVVALLQVSSPETATRTLLHESPDVRRAALRGCFLGAGGSLDPWITKNLADSRSPVGRSALLALAAERGLHVHSLARSLFSDDPEELVPALRAAWQAEPALHEVRIVELLAHPDSRVRDAAMVTALHHGSAHGWSLCQDLAFDPQTPHPFAMTLLAGLGEPGQHKRLGDLMGLESHRPWVLRSLGYTGNTGTVPPLLFHAQSDDPPTKAAALDALGTILGPDVDKVRTSKVAGALDRWWKEVHGRFDARRRYLGGRAVTRAAFVQALAHFPTRRRYLLSLLLSIRTGGRARVSTAAFSETQRAQLATLGSWKGPEEPWARDFSLF